MVRGLLLLLLTLCGCTALSARPERLELRDAEILEDTLWQGEVVVDGTVKVAKGATLTIRPGTEILFRRRDADRDGLGDGTLVVEGALHAVGNRARPIRFRSAEKTPQPGDWLEIRVDFSRDVQLRYCQITDSAYTLHAHFTRGTMEDCTIRGNIDGCRLGQSTFAIRNCLIERNLGKGINFRNATVEVSRNIIRYNGAGIFLFETDRDSRIEQNNLYGNIFNLRLGDFFTGAVSTEGNWWGTDDSDEAAASVYDRKQDPAIGTVSLEPARQWVAGTGPRDSLRMTDAWCFRTGGYVDAGPVVDGGALFAPSWDGHLYALDHDGTLLWERELGEVADSAVALDGDAVYCQSWGREVFAFDRRDGTLRWRFSYAPSPADDHRQGAPLKVADLLLVPAWNGTLYALEAESGASRWAYRAPLPLRAAPVHDGDRLYLASGSGSLVALTLGGKPLWRKDLGAPLLTPPALTPAGPVSVDREGRLVALDREGEIRWQRDLGERCYYSAPLFADGALYLATAAGSLWKFEAASGKTLWRVTGLGPVYATPLLAQGRLFVGDNGGTLHAVGADSGDLLATYEVEREIQGAPAVSGNRLFFASRDHCVHAVDLKGAEGEAGR